MTCMRLGGHVTLSITQWLGGGGAGEHGVGGANEDHQFVTPGMRWFKFYFT